MNGAIVSYNAEALKDFNAIDDLNAKIARVFRDYDVDLTLKFEWGKNFSKMVAEAQDAKGMPKEGKVAKDVRRDQFRKVQALFINEGVNVIIEALMHKLGYQPRFGGIAKTGDVNVKFVTVGRKETDVVGKVAVAQAKDKALVDRNRKTEARALALENALKARGVVDVEAEILSAKSE